MSTTANFSQQYIDGTPAMAHYDIHPCREDMPASARFEPNHILLEYAQFKEGRIWATTFTLFTRDELQKSIADELNGESAERALDAALRAEEERETV